MSKRPGSNTGRLLASLLAAGALGLAACGGSSADAPASAEPAAPAGPAPQPASSVTADTAEAPATSTSSGIASPPEAAPSPPAEPSPPPATPSREEYIALADPVCKAASDTLDALPEPADLAELAALLPQARVVYEQLRSDLDAIARPAADEAELSVLYAMLDEQIDQLDELRVVAEAGDEAALGPLLEEGTALEQRTDEAARAYGFAECGVDDEADEPAESTVTETVAAPADDRGDILVQYLPTGDETLDLYLNLVRDSGLLEELASALNDGLALPYDLTVSVEEFDGPAYYPDAQAIAMPPSFVGLLDNLFSGVSDDVEEIKAGILAATVFVLFHELGHAFVDAYDLPITGREEDAVDQLATYLATQIDPELGGQLALSGALFFGLAAAQRDEFEAADFWDEHGLDEQRFFNIVCWVYGSNPELFADEAEQAGIGVDRLERCPAEYVQIASAWETLMAPYVLE